MPKSKTLKMSDIQHVEGGRGKSGVQYFEELVPLEEKFSFSDHPGETFYIVKLEQKGSDNFGDGYIVHFKDFPNAAETMTAGVFGTIPAKQLDKLWQATLNGTRIGLSSPVAIKIEPVPTKKGMSYRFVSPKRK